MAYPDLMFLGQRPSRLIDSDVFEDMKLTSLIGADTISAMRAPCGAEDIAARQELFRALSNAGAFAHMRRLSDEINAVYSLSERYEGARCDNEKYVLYANLCAAISAFFSDAASQSGSSMLFKRFSDYFAGRTANSNFKRLGEALSEVMPMIDTALTGEFKIIGDSLRISSESPEPYMAKLLRDAECLGLTEVAPSKMEARPLDPSIIDAEAKLHPKVFEKLKAFYEQNKNFYEPELLRYRVETGFYLDICALCERVSEAGIPICYPKASETKKIDINNAYDITLLTKGESSIIPNDVYFDESEPFFYLTGANGGGKTTYLRTVGVNVLLFLNGCPAPCDRAEIYPLHNVFTHFPRDERFDNAGRNAEERQRVQRILDAADGCALVLLNETFSTTSEETALAQTTSLADRMYGGGEFGVYVTHQHNINDTKIPYLNVIIDRSDSNRRTYKVARQRSVYSSYAYDILQKYSLTKEQLDRRFPAKK